MADSASDNGWSGLVFDGKKFYHIYLIGRGIGGCAFSVGLIYGCIFRSHPDTDYGHIRTLITELSGHRNGRIRTPYRTILKSVTLRLKTT